MRGPKLSVRGKIMGTIVAVSVMVLALDFVLTLGMYGEFK